MRIRVLPISVTLLIAISQLFVQPAFANPIFTVSPITVIPSVVSITNGGTTVTATITVGSTNPIDQSRLPLPYFYQTSSVQGTRINGIWILVSGTSTSGTYQSTVTIPANTLTGQWLVGCIAFYDINGISSTNGGYDASFIVQNAADKAAADKAAADKAAADKAAAKQKADAAASAKAVALAAKKKTTITCVKGKLAKKITAVRPVCPKSYRKK